MTARAMANKAVDTLLFPVPNSSPVNRTMLNSIYGELARSAGRMDIHELLLLWLKLVYCLANDQKTIDFAPGAAKELLRQMHDKALKLSIATRYEALTTLAEHLTVECKAGDVVRVLLPALAALDKELHSDRSHPQERGWVHQVFRDRLYQMSVAYGQLPMVAERGASREIEVIYQIKEKPECVKIPTFFATFRQPHDTTDHPYNMYGAAWSDNLSYGIATVSVPRFRDAFTIPRDNASEPSKKRAEKIARGRYFVVEQIDRIATQGALIRALSETVGNKTLLVFTHGFRQSHASGLVHAAQLFRDLEFEGAPLLLSWPSGYLFGDRSYFDAIAESKKRQMSRHFATFLDACISRIQADTVVLVGHSLGCRVLGDALAFLDLKRPQIKSIVLGSPDIELKHFKHAVQPVLQAQKPLFVYASTRDKALVAASVMHQERAGRQPDKIAMKGIEVIATEQCYSEFFDFIRHSDFSYGAAPDLMRAIEGVSPSERGLYKRASSTRQEYWSFG